MCVILLGNNGDTKVCRLIGPFDSVELAERILEGKGWQAINIWRAANGRPDTRFFTKNGQWAHARELESSV